MKCLFSVEHDFIFCLCGKFHWLVAIIQLSCDSLSFWIYCCIWFANIFFCDFCIFESSFKVKDHLFHFLYPTVYCWAYGTSLENNFFSGSLSVLYPQYQILWILCVNELFKNMLYYGKLRKGFSENVNMYSHKTK